MNLNSKKPNDLKSYLSRYDIHTVPDYYFYAYRILHMRKRYPNREEILAQAVKDMEEEIASRPQKLFNDNRRQMEGLELKPYNWEGK